MLCGWIWLITLFLKKYKFGKMNKNIFLIRMYLQYYNYQSCWAKFCCYTLPARPHHELCGNELQIVTSNFYCLALHDALLPGNWQQATSQSAGQPSQPSEQLLLAQPSSSSLMRTKNGRPDVLLATAKSKINICLHLFQDERKPLIGWLAAYCIVP